MAELVAKTDSAVAVDSFLTTLIDWVNIEQVSGFTIIIENAGGGSANDITDVQIDTSDDGGVTSSLDQHAGVPAVPIASGSSMTGTFTDTSKFLRVRAVCASGNDTTAKAVLLADSVTARICTLTDVKDRLGITNTENDTMLNRLISNIEDIFNNYTKRKLLLNAAAVTEYYTGQGRYLQLDRYPVVSITSIKQALDYDFDNVDALIVNEGYRLLSAGKNGIIISIYLNWAETPDSIQVVYTGGYCSAGQTPGDGEYAMPADLREAAIEQVTFFFKRKDDIGLSGVGFQGGSISKFSAMDLLPIVKNILDSYRKPSL